jgi:hypothetical protein
VKIRDEHFAEPPSGDPLRREADFRNAHLELLEDRPDL